jgi:hypothetical protein
MKAGASGHTEDSVAHGHENGTICRVSWVADVAHFGKRAVFSFEQQRWTT